MPSSARPPFEIGDRRVDPGSRLHLELPIARLVSGTEVALPVIVFHGRTDGPTVWINAAIHGDEHNGVEIVRRVMARLDAAVVSGTVIAVPVVNVHGFNTGDRYLPDRRDLNRSFPGARRGSLAARIAHLMMTEVVERCSAGIDLHTGSDLRLNLPQIRANLEDPATLELATAFGAPVTIHSRTRGGSLRAAATKTGAVALLFEGGEAYRFDPHAIEVGTAGVLRVLVALGVLADSTDPAPATRLSPRSRWTRATRSGMIHLSTDLGDEIAKGDTVASIYDPFGTLLSRVKSSSSGLVIGRTQNALVNRGDAILHVAQLDE